MRLGIFAKTFAGADPLTVMRAAHDAGYTSVQYNMACSGLPAMPDSLHTATALQVADAARSTGIRVAAVSGTYNMIHPDPAVRADGLRRLGVMIDACAALGTPMVTLCTGTRDPHDQWRGHPENRNAETWVELLTEMGKACAMAEARGVRLGIEPELANVVDSAVRARALIDTLRSPALAIVLDPANLFEVDPNRDRIIAEAIDLLADRIVMAHAKDRAPNGDFVAAGQGVVNFPDFVARLRAAGFDGDLVTHGLTAAEASGVAQYLAGLLA